MESEIKAFHCISLHMYCPQNMGKVILDSAGKLWENRTFQGQVVLRYFVRSINPCNS